MRGTANWFGDGDTRATSKRAPPRLINAGVVAALLRHSMPLAWKSFHGAKNHSCGNQRSRQEAFHLGGAILCHFMLGVSSRLRETSSLTDYSLSSTCERCCCFTSNVATKSTNECRYRRRADRLLNLSLTVDDFIELDLN